MEGWGTRMVVVVCCCGVLITVTGAPQLGHGPEIVLTYCQMLNAIVARSGTKIANRKSELKNPNTNPPTGETKTRIPTSKPPPNFNKSAKSLLLGGGGGGNWKVMRTDVVVTAVGGLRVRR